MEVIKEVSNSSLENVSKFNKSIKEKSNVQNKSIHLSDFDEIREPSKSSSQKKHLSQNKSNFNKNAIHKNEAL